MQRVVMISIIIPKYYIRLSQHFLVCSASDYNYTSPTSVQAVKLILSSLSLSLSLPPLSLLRETKRQGASPGGQVLLRH